MVISDSGFFLLCWVEEEAELDAEGAEALVDFFLLLAAMRVKKRVN